MNSLHIVRLCLTLWHAAPVLQAQIVQATFAATTPITVQALTGTQTVGTTVPAGPLAPQLIEAILPGSPGPTRVAAAWGADVSAGETLVALTHQLESYVPGATLDAGPHEFQLAFTATANTPARLLVSIQASTWPGSPTPTITIDVDDDGLVEFPFVSGGTTSIDAGTFVFGTQPKLVGIRLQSSVQGVGRTYLQLRASVVPANNVFVNPAAIGCAPLSPQSMLVQPVFADRGIDFASPQIADPMVLVLGLNQQPVLLPPFFGTTCLLLPALDIVLFDPAPSEYHVALPASVRPVTFHAQGVEVTTMQPTLLLPTDAVTVQAY